MPRSRRVMGSLAVALLVGALGVPLSNRPVVAAPVPPGFQEQVVFSGLVRPTNIEFAPDGRVFVAEQRGTIKVFDGLADPTATVFADLQPVVHGQWDRGLLGMALHPDFPAEPWVYVLYTYDAPPGQTAPFWNDDCNSVPGGSNGGRCVVTARLARLPAAGSQAGPEQVLLHDWCQQFPSHSVGSLRFGADGALYVSAGDGGSFSTVDYGQLPSGGPVNPCGDPPDGTMQPPTAEGGALRAQALRSNLSNPLDLDGAILRLDPATGAAMPDNPLAGNPDPNRARVVAHGLRNPYRITTRPGTSEVWTGDVGWRTWEEINVLADPTGSSPANFGWPCYEGAGVMDSYANAGLNLCATLYSGAGQTPPHYTYNHAAAVVPGESCATGGSSVTGLAFYPVSGGPYPAAYRGALFFADQSRQCIWAMKPAAPGGLPSPEHIENFVAAASTPVDLEVGPGGELYWADIAGGTIRRVRYTPGNTPPTAVIDAAPTSGSLPLAVQFDGTGSFDPDPADQESLTYEWDFTGDGTVDATGPTTQFTYTSAGTFAARLTVTDPLDGSDSSTVTIAAGSQAPTATIDTPAAGHTWAVGDQISFTGHATDAQGSPLPAAALRWELRIEHCTAPGSCHTHVGQTWNGVAGGSFLAPDHEYPSHLELVLTAEAPGGLTHTVVRELHPKTVQLTVASDPPGLQLSLGGATGAGPFTETVIQGSANTISAPSPQNLGGVTYTFEGWSQGGPRTQVVTAPAVATTYTASFAAENQPTNLALGRPATANAQCSTNERPAKAVNGSWTGGLHDKWCARGNSYWWRVDLGSVVDIGTVVIRHAGAGGEDPRLNTRKFTIQVSNDAVTWTTVAAVSTNTQDVTTHELAASGRYVRVNVAIPSNNGIRVARIYEVEVYPPG